MAETAWRRGFRAPRVSLPTWARDAADRLLYSSNEGGTWELYAWDRVAGTRRQVTDRPEGTLAGALDPAGERVWWFDDNRGSEFGVWRTQPFVQSEGIESESGSADPAAPGLGPAYGA